MSGIKHDQGKAPLELLSPKALTEIAKVFGHGRDKYGKWNYRGGMDWSRVIGASLRHISSFNEGENLDPESNICHLAHAAACCIMLLDYYLYELGKDDRWRKPADKCRKEEK